MSSWIQKIQVFSAIKYVFISKFKLLLIYFFSIVLYSIFNSFYDIIKIYRQKDQIRSVN